MKTYVVACQEEGAPFVIIRIDWGIAGTMSSTIIGRHVSYGIADYWRHQLMTLQKTEEEVHKALASGMVG